MDVVRAKKGGKNDQSSGEDEEEKQSVHFLAHKFN